MAIRVGATQRSVGLAALPGYRQNVRDTTGEALEGVGQGIDRLGQGLGSAARKIQDERAKAAREQDNARVQGAIAELIATKQSLIEDPENGLVARKGEAALAESDSIKSFYEAKARDLRTKLSSDEQRAAFDGVWGEEKTSFSSVVDRHVFRESEQLKKDTHAALLSGYGSEAEREARSGDLGDSNLAVMRGLGAIEATDRAEGRSRDITKQRQREFETAARLAATEAILKTGRIDPQTGEPEAATYLRSWRSRLDAGMVEKSGIDKMLAGAKLGADADKAAGEAWVKGGDPARALEHLRATIKDPQLLEEATERVQKRGAAEATARRQSDAEPLGMLEQQLYGPGATFSTTDPRSAFHLLSEEGKGSALRMREARRRSLKSASNEDKAAQNSINRGALADFKALDLYGEEGDDQATVDITARYAAADKPTRDAMVAIQKVRRVAAREGRGVNDQEFRRKALAQAEGIDIDGAAGGKAKNGSKAQSYLNYVQDQADAWFADPKNAGHKSLPSDVAQQIIDDALIYGEGKNTGLFDDDNRYAFEAAMRGEEFIPFPAKEQPKRSAAPPAAPAAVKPPAPARPDGSRRVTNGKRTAWLPPGQAMPEGWRPVK